MNPTSLDNETVTYSDEELAALINADTFNNQQTADESSFPLLEESETSKPSLSSNPLLQFGVVAVGTGALTLILYALVGNVNLPETTADKPVLTQPDNVEQTAPGTDGEIKTGLAFGEADSDLAALSDMTELEDKDNSATNSNTAGEPTAPVASATPYSSSAPATIRATPVTYRAPLPVPVSTPTPQRAVFPTAPVVPAPLNTSTSVALPLVKSTEIETTEEATIQPAAAAQLQTQPENLESEENIPTRTIPTGSIADAVLSTPLMLASGVSVPAWLLLIQPLITAEGTSCYRWARSLLPRLLIHRAVSI